jgi:hypothetical protein
VLRYAGTATQGSYNQCWPAIEYLQHNGAGVGLVELAPHDHAASSAQLRRQVYSDNHGCTEACAVTPPAELLAPEMQGWGPCCCAHARLVLY